jgi:hypothetical protein
MVHIRMRAELVTSIGKNKGTSITVHSDALHNTAHEPYSCCISVFSLCIMLRTLLLIAILDLRVALQGNGKTISPTSSG